MIDSFACYQSASAKEKGAFLTALTKAAHHGNLLPKISTHTKGYEHCLHFLGKGLSVYGLTFTNYFCVLFPMSLVGFGKREIIANA